MSTPGRPAAAQHARRRTAGVGVGQGRPHVVVGERGRAGPARPARWPAPTGRRRTGRRGPSAASPTWPARATGPAPLGDAADGRFHGRLHGTAMTAHAMDGAAGATGTRGGRGRRLPDADPQGPSGQRATASARSAEDPARRTLTAVPAPPPGPGTTPGHDATEPAAPVAVGRCSSSWWWRWPWPRGSTSTTTPSQPGTAQSVQQFITVPADPSASGRHPVLLTDVEIGTGHRPLLLDLQTAERHRPRAGRDESPAGRPPSQLDRPGEPRDVPGRGGGQDGRAAATRLPGRRPPPPGR